SRAPDPDDLWERTSRRITTRRRRRRVIGSCVAALIVALGVLGTVVVSGRGTSSPRVRVEERPSSEAFPSRIVAVTSDRRLVVLDAHTGAVVRTLADGVSAASHIAVSPDGRIVYFTRDAPSTDGHCGNTPVPHVAYVSIDGGPESALAVGGETDFLAISADGRS